LPAFKVTHYDVSRQIIKQIGVSTVLRSKRYESAIAGNGRIVTWAYLNPRAVHGSKFRLTGLTVVYENIGPRKVDPYKIKSDISIPFNQIAVIRFKRHEAAIGGNGRGITVNIEPRPGAILHGIYSGNTGSLFPRARNGNAFRYSGFQVADKNIFEAI